jgi:hypothetical protein
MSRTIKPYNYRFRSEAGVAGRESPSSGSYCRFSNQGYALLLVMMTITLLLVSLTAALPSAYMEAQREREEELIFRGNEYVRAIGFYHARFARYPASVDELVKKTNGFRFLRRAYKDPMSKNGKWRFIHVDNAGMPIDSKSMNMRAGAGPGGANSPLGGNAGSTTGLGQSGSPNSIFGPSTSGTTGFGFGQSGSTNSAFGGTARGTPGLGQTGSMNREPSGNDQTPSNQGPADQPEAGAQQPSSGFLSGGQTMGAFIAGVASSSKKRSVRVLNGKTRYDEWEFLGIGMNPSGTQLIAAPGGIGPGSAGSAGSTPGQSILSPQPTQPTPQEPVAEPAPVAPEPQPTEGPVEPEPPGAAEPQQ